MDKIKELLEMCESGAFDPVRAEELIGQTDVNARFESPRFHWETSLLNEAIYNDSVEMTELLLQCGADPNAFVNEEYLLWDLQYPTDIEYGCKDPENADRADEARLKIAQLLLEYGADPCMKVDGENIFSYVMDAVFNDDEFYPRLLEHRSRFFILLVAYGGHNDYVTPSILKPFDKSKLLAYRFKHIPVGNGYFLTGEILDESGETVAEI